MKTVTAHELRRMILDAEELALLDAREEGTFHDSHIFYASCCALSRLERLAPRLVPRRSARVVVCDAGAGEAARAACRLLKHGYSSLPVRTRRVSPASRRRKAGAGDDRRSGYNSGTDQPRPRDSQTTMATLTNEEIRAYEDDGYVVPAYRVPEECIAVLGAAMEEVIAANSDTRPEQLPNIHITNGAGTRLKGHRAFLDIVMWGCQIFCKPGSDGMEVPMHQDGQYWPIRPLATCTVWLAIDDSDRENGCLTVIPGSHRGRVHFRHRTRTHDDIVLNQTVDDPRAFDRPPACVELERGQLSMHDIHLIHGSAPNTSGRRRAGVAIRYMPTTSWFRRGLEMPFSGYQSNFADRPIWLARGRDICGKNDFSIGHAEPKPYRAAACA